MTHNTKQNVPTNWAVVREEREFYSLSAPDESGPAKIKAMLAAAQVPCVENHGLIFLTDTPFTIALVSATELFHWDSEQSLKISKQTSRLSAIVNLFQRKIGVWRETHTELAGPNAYLYVVDLDKWLAQGDNRVIADLTISDSRVVRKIVCGLDLLLQLISNPFEKSYSGPRPQLDVQRADPVVYQPLVRDFNATVTHAFTARSASDAWVLKMLRHPEAARVKARANKLVSFILGPNYQFTDNDTDIAISRNRIQEVTWDCLGTSEQYSLAFCAYLALVAETATNETWLGISEVLNYFDEVRFFNFIDLLHHFIVATGANVYIRTNRTDYRELCLKRLTLSVECIPDSSN